MSTKEIKAYYASTENSDTRSDLVHAVSLLSHNHYKVAIDCGCGAGSDIAFLRKNDFTVYAFDIEENSILRCKKRFKNDNNVLLFQDSFISFVYPKASLVLADASLFFCPPTKFRSVWNKIKASIMPKGVFCGSFLGPNDTMSDPDYNREAFWPDVMVLTDNEIRKLFVDFEIMKWTEHNISGETAQGIPHHWHIYSVVAKTLHNAHHDRYDS